MDIPHNIVLDQLPGPIRGEGGMLYFRDQIIWSPEGTHFALAYTIGEVTMCNEQGCVLWGAASGPDGVIFANPRILRATCWRSPWCRWLDDRTFIFKAAVYHRRSYHPHVAIHVDKGFQIIPGTNDHTLWIDAAATLSDVWIAFDEDRLLKEILNT